MTDICHFAARLDPCARCVGTPYRRLNLKNISVACEFPDVFLEDLPGMPPD
jgi:hypothetical protein